MRTRKKTAEHGLFYQFDEADAECRHADTSAIGKWLPVTDKVVRQSDSGDCCDANARLKVVASQNAY